MYSMYLLEIHTTTKRQICTSMKSVNKTNFSSSGGGGASETISMRTTDILSIAIWKVSSFRIHRYGPALCQTPVIALCSIVRTMDESRCLDARILCRNPERDVDALGWL